MVIYRNTVIYRCHLPMTSLKSPYGVLYTTWSQKFFSAKGERLISLPVKFKRINPSPINQMMKSIYIYRNVEEDLLRGSHPHDINAENTEPSGTFYFDFYSQNEPNPTSPHTHHHFEEHRDQDVFSFEQQMMSELDNMMKNMFGGMDRNMFHSFPHDSDSPKEDYIMISPPDSGKHLLYSLF